RASCEPRSGCRPWRGVSNSAGLRFWDSVPLPMEEGQGEGGATARTQPSPDAARRPLPEGEVSQVSKFRTRFRARSHAPAVGRQFRRPPTTRRGDGENAALRASPLAAATLRGRPTALETTRRAAIA